MAFCRKCGKEIDDEAVICVHCGVPTDLYFKELHNENNSPEKRIPDSMTFIEETDLMKQRDPEMAKVSNALMWLAIIGIFLAMFINYWFYPLLSLPGFIYSFFIIARGYKKNGRAMVMTYLILGIVILCFMCFMPSLILK